MSTQDRELCLRLLRAETEEEVVAILRSAGFWDNRTAWRPYGDITNNRGVVGNQQSSPVAALVEKLVNSIDAILIAECLRAGIDPAGPHAPQTMQAAVERLLGIRDGRVQNLDPSSRTQYAERIRLVACGTKDQPAYLIIDDGEGQAPDEFPDTLLSLLRENKTAIPFVQGKFNMGGTGVLQFAGTHSFQLVISKRQPNLPPKPSPRRHHWGFTLIRRLDPGPSQPQTMYVYLAPGGRVPSFESDTLQVLPGRYPEAYVGELAAGTCIKLWNYKFPGRLKTLATLDLRYALERHLQDPALPIRIHERRSGYRAHYYDTTMAGLSSVLADDRDRIEPGLDTGGPMDVAGVGSVQLRLVVLKESDEAGRAGSERYGGGVFFNVNGQLHSELGSDFIARRTKFDYIAKDMIVIVDCTELPQRVREDLFLASRDRMRQCQERDALEDAIVEYLKDHQGLRELNARRRQARLQSRAEEDTSAVIQSLIRADPSLAAVFGKGQKIKVPIGPLPEPEPYVGKHFPTFFRIAHEPKGGLVKACPLNRTCRVEFETDAANDYFSRSTDPGRLEVRGAPRRVGSLHLWNGKAVLRFAPPPASNPGDRLQVTVLVSDISRVVPFESSFMLEVEAEAPPAPPGPPSPPPGASLTSLPNIIEVRQDQWELHGFNERAALELKYGDEDTIDMYINMDNLYLRNEIARRRALDPDLLRYWFKYGLCLLALGMLYQYRQSRREGAEATNQGANGDENGGEVFGTIAEAAKGLAVTIIPAIAQLGKGKTEGST
jgi:hypothetical protein